MEIWKDIKGYEGLYQVSNLGIVKSLKCGKEIILKNGTNKWGYYHVGLHLNKMQHTKYIHKLVAMAFLNHIPSGSKLVVNHKNFIRSDNNVNNLEIVQMRENSNQKHLKSSSNYTGVCWHKNNEKWLSSIRINGKKKHLGYFNNEYDAHLAYENELKLL